MIDKREVTEARIKALAEAVKETYLEECKKHNYSDVECYFSIKYILEQWRYVLGPERTKELDKGIIVVTPDMLEKMGEC